MAIAICVSKSLLPELRKIPGLFNESGEVPECNLDKISDPRHQEALCFIQIGTNSYKTATFLFLTEYPDYHILCLRRE